MKASHTVRNVKYPDVTVEVEGPCGAALFQFAAKILIVNSISQARMGRTPRAPVDVLKETMRRYGLEVRSVKTNIRNKGAAPAAPVFDTKVADRIDGFNRDDIGESFDY